MKKLTKRMFVKTIKSLQKQMKYDNLYKENLKNILGGHINEDYNNDLLSLSIFNVLISCIFNNDNIVDKYLGIYIELKNIEDIESLYDDLIKNSKPTTISEITFIRAINSIKKQMLIDHNYSKLWSKVFPNAFEANLLYDNKTLYIAFTSLLQDLTLDLGLISEIEYFIYDMSFGKNSIKHHYSTAKELYAYLNE